MEVASAVSERRICKSSCRQGSYLGETSNVVILENLVREDTKGTREAVNAKYEPMERGGYIPAGCKFDPVILNAKLSLAFLRRGMHSAPPFKATLT
jgi:hypothetical protein